MPWPNTEEGREKKRADQRRWWHKKFGGEERAVKAARDEDAEENRMNEQIEYHNDETKDQTPHVFKSELEELFYRVTAQRQRINELTEKRDTIHPEVITHAVDKFGSPLDEVELKDVQEQENARVERLRQRYDVAIVEKEEEYAATKNQIEVMKQRRRDLEVRIRDLKRGIIPRELGDLAECRATSEHDLAMHTAVLNDNKSTELARVYAHRGKKLAETQIRGQIQKEADYRRVIPELEAMLSYLDGDFEGQRKLQKQLDKQKLQLVKDLKPFESNGDEVADEQRKQPVFVEFLQPWGGYREGMFQRVASLSEEVSADLVDAKIVQYVARVTRSSAE
jgi:hypothetical protein